MEKFKTTIREKTSNLPTFVKIVGLLEIIALIMSMFNLTLTLSIGKDIPDGDEPYGDDDE